MDLNLNGKTAFISASSSGLGKACATQLALEGVNVVISGRNKEKLKEVSQEINSYSNGKCDYVVFDLLNAEDIKSAIKFTKERFGMIDILINNSGGPPSGKFEEFIDDDWEFAYQLNLLSYVRLIREVLPDMKKLKSGRIINLSSSSIKQPIPGLLLSNVFRLGVMGLSKTLSQELAEDNILVNTVAPGRIATERVATLDNQKAEKLDLSLEEVEKMSQSHIPLGRYGKPEEFGSMVAFLASEKSSFITGSSIIIDGGMVKSL